MGTVSNVNKTSGDISRPVHVTNDPSQPIPVSLQDMIEVRNSSGSALSNPLFEYGDISPPVSYATGGFVLDLSARFSTVQFISIELETQGSLPPCRMEITRNFPSDGKITIKIIRSRYDKASSIGNVSGQPAGVTVQAASGSQVSANSAQSHADTGVVSTSDNTLSALGAGVDSQGATHTHSGSSDHPAHQHVDNNIYQHQHSISNSETDLANTEISAGTNLSSTVFRYLAVGSGL